MSTACVVEDAVQYDADATVVEFGQHGFEILHRAEAAIDTKVVVCVVAVGARVKNRREVDGVHAQIHEVIIPTRKVFFAGGGGKLFVRQYQQQRQKLFFFTWVLGHVTIAEDEEDVGQVH